ncbi:MAG: threonine--tRNA ligase [Candidatus Terrybacteria bacterium RIFCSPLOWO2_01_FULL_44_24]|uniref:Threonine--tRNA ligase n=1 Tax=Candidatus Terrybacteria bacterium RIFCSPHIGHO2_01_FULL_43_35 TaxID=1802361 RepID=A0A1G2PFG1_9BACT|nr:MAG: threonine--tRNA ligase [Candidatus Terrybacteria bacterium RIFCSPHIGHO2_01_FULL_43_35]OHA49611.1 MAG: threonine--tRNA ligase [Candidatus Terrybacteria bacterium RIFCSPHIGHO2_02_FULL_43_14]OHA51497.1 MAG: threonine--tRNA ligase [Candidatus Terrybacteria bacterium RIFCSPLOWO2_01_FULL_44_24]
MPAKKSAHNDVDTLRHSTAHILAQAVQELWPGTRLGIGPVIENGFYYDIDPPSPLHQDDLEKIEAQMIKIIKQNLPFKKSLMPIKKALDLFKNKKAIYKVDLIKDLMKGGEKKVSIYATGKTFIDLCTGPHVENTRKIPQDAFTLTNIASAYWRGDENNPQLTRIYGIAFKTKKELLAHQELLVELEKRDHRKLGTSLDLFSFHDIAPGAPFWHPKGMIIVKALESYWRAVHDKAAYQEIATPIMVKAKMFERSGHWKYYKENMFHFDSESETFVLKPMNCPESTYVYSSRIRSFRDLPLRLSEIGRLHRNELSGTLGGLFRVRQFTMDDAHIYLGEDQIQKEIENIIGMVENFYALFELTPRFFLSTKPDKALGTPSQWRNAEKALSSALKAKKRKFEIKPKDGAFYGPKIDIHISDALGRDWQLATIQLDLVMLPEKFDLHYVDAKGKKIRPVVIHRAIFGSFERFIGVLLEHTAGNLPVWLSPNQIRIIPVADRHASYGAGMVKILSAKGFRIDMAEPNQTLGKNIREAELAKIPFLLIIGDREVTSKTVSVRQRAKGDRGTMPVDEFMEMFQQLIPQELR